MKKSVASLLCLFAFWRASPVHAGCNLIPVAEKFYPSTSAGSPSGSVSAPIAAPNRFVRVKVNPSCDVLPPGFTGFQPTDTVSIRFEPPNGGPMHTVAAASVSVVDSTTLQFQVPSASALATLYPPSGLAGPATIIVQNASTQTIASIGPLSQPTHTCDREAETVFQHFTILPPPNSVALQSSSPTEILMTVDGGGNLLIPLDHTGAGVLPLGPGSPVARLLRADTVYPAFPSGPTPTLSQSLASALTLPGAASDSLLRSFTIDGRPLPPLLRLDNSGAIFGTTDADFSVIRIASRDANNALIFDVNSRFTGSPPGMGGGPVSNDPEFTLTRCDPVPVRGLRSAAGAAAFARDESLEGANLNNGSGDGDMSDRIVQVLDIASGGQSCGTNTHMAVIDNNIQGFSGPPGPLLDASGSVVAFLESEAAQNNTDLNGDGDTQDGILRVFTSDGVEKTASLPLTAIDRGPRVNGRTFAISGSLVYARTPDGDLGFVEKEVSGGGGPFLNGASATATSPDGKHAYVVSTTDVELNAFSRNLVTGALSFVNADATGLQSPLSVLVSPDGAHVYVGNLGNGSMITTFNRNGGTGAVTFNSTFSPGIGPTRQVEAMAMSSDGQFIYTADFQNDQVFAFPLAAGLPTAAGATAVTDNFGGVDGLQGAFSLALSPDNANLYVAGSAEDAVAVFSRNAATGALTFIEAKFEGFDGVTGLNAPESVAVSPDGRHVYASGSALDTTVVFSRDPQTGRLTFVQHVTVGGSSVVLAPAGGEVHVANVATNVVTTLSRNAFTGVLSPVTTRADGDPGGFDGLAGAGGLAVSPDGKSLYVAGSTDNAVAVLGSSQGMLKVLDPNPLGTPIFRTTPQVAAAEVAVSGTHAAILTPESAGGVTNGDADASDLVPQVYDATADTLTSLGVAANRIAMGNDLVAMSVPEAGQGVNINGDADSTDDVLVWWRVGDPTPASLAQTLGTAVTGPGLTVVNAPSGDFIVSIAPEKGNGIQDLNLDGDTNDQVLSVIDMAGPVVLSNFALAADDFIAGGHLIAFRVNEAAQGNTDLNGNGSPTESVMYIADLNDPAAPPISTGQAAIPCTINGCEDKTPYKISGDTVSFLTREADQNQDLNGDNDKLDTVLQVFNVRSRKIQRLTTVIDGTLPVPAPLPDTSFGDPIVYVEAKDVDDINHNSDTTDDVVLIVGDQDGDGTFDTQDTCVEQTNDLQDDNDLDGLGDSCDPNAFCDAFVPAAPLPAPLASAACQKTLGKAGSTYLKKRATAMEKCLDGIAKGDLTGDATDVCRGSIIGSVDVTPSDPKALKKLDKAIAKFLTKAATCTDGEVAPLDACGNTAADVATCASSVYASGAIAAMKIAYGDVTLAPLETQQACLKAIGKASTKYVGKVTQAMQKCLDRVSAGTLVGDAQVLCLGRLTVGGVVLPSDSKTAGPIGSAETKLRADIANKCPDPMLAGLTACGTSVTTAGNCLVCGDWRRAAEAIRSIYGPQ